MLVHTQPKCLRSLRYLILAIFLSVATLLLTMMVLMWNSRGQLTVSSMFGAEPETNYHGFCAVPYDFAGMDPEMIGLMQELRSLNEGHATDEQPQQQQQLELLDAQSSSAIRQLFASAFLEHFDLDQDEDDADDEGFSRVTVPTFRDGRSGRFLHDFKYNQSLIVDKAEANCFIMPLDRETVLKPRNMQDLIVKMNEGYYNIDTGVLRKNMRVVMPALADTTNVAPRIVSECQGMDIYRLERFTGRGKFAGFLGAVVASILILNTFVHLQCSSAAPTSCRRTPNMRTSAVNTLSRWTLSIIRSSSSIWPLGSRREWTQSRSWGTYFQIVLKM